MFTANNNLFWKDESIYFAGYSYGFETKYQQVKHEEERLNHDTFVYKYDFNQSNDCLISKETKLSSISDIVETKTSSTLKSEGLFTLYLFDDFNPLSEAVNLDQFELLEHQ